MNFVTKARYFLAYRREVSTHREELMSRFNMKVDQLGRLYTIYSVPEKDVTQYGKEFTTNALKSYLNRLDSYLIGLGIADMYGKLEEERLNDNQVRVVIGYRFFDAERVANILLTTGGYVLMGLGAGIAFAVLFFLGKHLNFF